MAPIIEEPVELPAILLQRDEVLAVSASGPGERYALGMSQPAARFGTAEAGELPESYGTGRLMLAARDPHWLCAWWDLTAEDQRRHNQLSATGHLAVRVYLDELRDQPFTQVEVHPESKHWFIQVGRGGARFVAELGYPSKPGWWVRLAVSRPTVTPSEKLAAETPELVEFMTLPPELPKEQLVAIVKEAWQEHAALVEVFAQLRSEGRAEPVPRVAAAQPRGEITPATQHTERAEAPRPRAKRVKVQSSPPAHLWTPEQERALAAIVRQDEEQRVWLDSVEITELVRRQWERGLERALFSGALGEAPELRGGPAQLELGSISSPLGGGEAGAPRGFWFNVNAELIIYGATERDARVTIGGRPIKLRPDGSFSYRFALPDGQYELPVVARAAAGDDAREAGLKFSRDTHYRGAVEAHPQDAALKPPHADHVS